MATTTWWALSPAAKVRIFLSLLKKINRKFCHKICATGETDEWTDTVCAIVLNSQHYQKVAHTYAKVQVVSGRNFGVLYFTKNNEIFARISALASKVGQIKNNITISC